MNAIVIRDLTRQTCDSCFNCGGSQVVEKRKHEWLHQPGNRQQDEEITGVANFWNATHHKKAEASRKNETP